MWLHGGPWQPLWLVPLRARAPPVAVPGRALPELRGGCSRRPGRRRREAVPQFVANQGVRAVPRAGQQCVNKPTTTPPPPRRARRAPAAAAARSVLLAPASPAGPAPRPAPLAPSPPRPAPAGAGSLTYRPTRARARAPRAPRRPPGSWPLESKVRAMRGDPGGFPARRGPGKFLASLFSAGPGEAPGAEQASWAGGDGPGARGSQVAQPDSGAGGRAARLGGRRAERGGRRGGAGRGAGEGGPRGTFSSPEGLPPALAAAPPRELPALRLERDHEMCLKKLTQLVTLAAS